MLHSHPETSFNSWRSESIDDVSGQPERNRFRWRQDLALLERDAQVDVDQLGRLVVQQNVLHVTVAWRNSFELAEILDNQQLGNLARLWIWLLVTETAADARSPRVVATSWGSTVQVRKDLSL